MILEPTALAFATAGLVPLLGYVMWSDMAGMRIPNAACLLIFLIFIPTGLMGLPLEIFGWRIGHTVIAFFLGFLLFQISGGQVGGGDLKLLIALTPYVNYQTLPSVLVIVSLAILALLPVFWLAYRQLRGRTTGLEMFDQPPTAPGSILKASLPYFPAGVPIGLGFIIYLVMLLTGVLQPG
ncbi:MAG: prepilin peptidase [Pseudomonadota bacterium]